MSSLQINGVERTLEVSADTPLLWALRDGLDMTGTKYGCGAGLCGACTVLVDGQPGRSCQLTVGEAAGKSITTIEGMTGEAGRAVIAAWIKLQVAQCGYCQSGQVLAATALLTANRKPSDADIDAAMDGNLCQCASYVRIRKAIHEAARALA